jgi:hypothetical protein
MIIIQHRIKHSKTGMILPSLFVSVGAGIAKSV